MKKTTAVAISGGVDSLMAACFLKEKGQDVIGIHFITGFEAGLSPTQHPQADNQPKILGIGKQLGIPVEIVDIRAEFQEKIVDYFTQTYKRGQSSRCEKNCLLYYTAGLGVEI